MPLHPLAALDRRYVWHPFTQMQDWMRQEPIVIESGRGAVLRDVRGREYLDANSSIWTNLHGHRHPRLDAALRRQLGRIAHSSALGLASGPAAELAARLVAAAEPRVDAGAGERSGEGTGAEAEPVPHAKAGAGGKVSAAGKAPARLAKVFFSDDGSTALEAALKLAYEHARRTRGGRSRPRFLSLEGAYHGDTVGAVSVGHIDLFHRAYEGMLFKTDRVMAPYCYRCPFNRAAPERADARTYRKCGWECVGKMERVLASQRKRRGEPYAAFVFEPLMQGAAGMIPQPSGWLRQVTDLARGHGALLVADEVMTGFGRTGVTCHVTDEALGRVRREPERTRLFATARVGVTPDLLCVAKGLTGGYLPMAATLATGAIFDAFLGRYEEFRTFFHGHSYTGNALGASVALASLDELEGRAGVLARGRLQRALRDELAALWALPQVGDIRQVGLVVGIELVRDWRTREAFRLEERVGQRVCEAMARRGVLTRPIGSVVVLMPPYCTTPAQVRRMVGALAGAVEEVLGRRRPAVRR